LFLLCINISASSAQSETPPNILHILADDLGYGDVAPVSIHWIKSELPKHVYSVDCRAGMAASNFNHEEV